MLVEMEDHHRSQSWGPFTTRTRSNVDQIVDDAASDTCEPTEQEPSAKQAALLKKLLPVGSHLSMKCKRRTTARQRQCPWTAERSRHSSDSDDGSSFVALKNNPLLNSGPILCPPIPPAYNIPEDTSFYSSFASMWKNLRQDQAVSSGGHNCKRVCDELKTLSLNKGSGELQGAGHRRRHTHDVSYRHEKVVPSLETVFDSTETSQPIASPFVGYAVEQNVDSLTEDSKSEDKSSEQMWRNRSRSSLLSGKLQFCPDEGILILDQYQYVQRRSLSHVIDHKKTRSDFMMASKQGRKLRKRAFFGGIRYKRTSFVSKASSVIQRTAKDTGKSQTRWRFVPNFLKSLSGKRRF